MRGKCEQLREFHNANGLMISNSPRNLDMPAEKFNLIFHFFQHLLPRIRSIKDYVSLPFSVCSSSHALVSMYLFLKCRERTSVRRSKMIMIGRRYWTSPMK